MAGILIHYLGPEATFTHSAAEQFAKSLNFADVELKPVPSIEHIFMALSEGGPTESVAYGCVPLENSIQGSVTTTWDMIGRLARDSAEQTVSNAEGISTTGTDTQLQIHGALTLPINQHLLTWPGAGLEEVEEVLSHPQALAQCQAWLTRFLPQARRITVASTADAARTIRKNAHGRQAAIGPRQAGVTYGLSCSDEAIQTNIGNVTRFGLIGTHQSGLLEANSLPISTWTMSLLLVGVGNQPGGLLAALEPFRALHFSLSRIESRPVGNRLGEYVFYIDVQWGFQNRPPEDIPAWQAVKDTLVRLGIEAYNLGVFPEFVLSQAKEE